MVDSVKVYTKLKESFNWPDDSDDSPDSTMTKAPASGSNVSSSETAPEGVTTAAVAAPAPLTSMDRYVIHITRCSTVEKMTNHFNVRCQIFNPLITLFP